MATKENMEKIKELLKNKNLELCEENPEKLGSGGFGSVFKVRKINNKNLIFAAKVIKGEINEIKEKVTEFRGKNIIKINSEIVDKDNKLYIIIMELSEIGHIGKLYYNGFLTINDEKKDLSYLNLEKDKRIFKEPFVEKFGDNLTRFFTKQLISAIKTFNQGNLVHYDIKPLNILLFKNLEIKLIDFSFLKRLDDKKEPKTIPGGTAGYLTPEFHYKNNYYMEDDELRTQDYFAIGATIFFLKYGKNMLNYNTYIKEIEESCKIEESKAKEKKRKEKLDKKRDKYKNIAKELTGDILVYLLDNAINYIKRQKFQDKNFDEFLCGLIQFKPKYRMNFEKIIRNQWLNKNLEEIEKIEKINIFDESNLLLELQKSDFIINDVNHYRQEFDKLDETYDKEYINYRKGKFKFGKKKKNNI